MSGIDDAVLRDPEPLDAFAPDDPLDVDHPHDRRRRGPGDNVAHGPWPPPSRGPLPPPESIPDDLNIFTAQDEIDAWAHEHDRMTERIARLRRLLSGRVGQDDDCVEARYLRERAAARRAARASPVERGRRTSADIDEEVNEALLGSRILQQKMALEAELDTALQRLFRARDNISRLDAYVRSLPRVSDRP